MKKLIAMGVMALTVFFYAGCGGGGGSAAVVPDDGEAGGGTASVQTLSALPTVDLSSYDSSSSASASISALAPKSFASAELSEGLSAKVFGDKAREVGGSSRAGCESNMHKKEVFRMSQAAQLDRCYPEAMEKIGLISIPAGSYAYYQITPPEKNDSEKGAMCDGIPAERTEEKAACEQGSDGPGGKTMLMRVGRFDNDLRVDMCQSGALENEATYTASGSQYTASIVRKGNFGGRNESSSFSMLVDLGASGSVTDSIVTLGADGLVSATGRMIGGNGNGTISFDRNGTGASAYNIVKGAFNGGFTDPFSGTATSFTGKTYAKFDSLTGCGKFSFTGSQPAMRVSDMIPFNIPANQQSQFLQTMGAQMGIPGLAIADKLCPNPLFDPENPSSTIKPMLLMTEAACGSVTNTGVECFSVVNGTSTTGLGTTEVTQTFTRIANSGSTYYDAVNAFDLATIDATAVDSIAFARDWDCSGVFTTVDFSSITPEAMQTAMLSCKDLEMKARNNDGMGGYNCGKGEQQNIVNDVADSGGGGDLFGTYGGEYTRVATSCLNPGIIPEKVLVNVVDANANTYCVPRNGACTEFTVITSDPTPHAEFVPPGLDMGNGVKLVFFNNYNMNGNPPNVNAAISANGAPCSAGYTINRPEFTGGGSFGAGGGGTRPGEAGFIPQPCVARGWTAPDKAQSCMDLCSKPENQTACRPTS